MARARHLTLRLPQGRAADAALAMGVFAVVAVGSARSLYGERAEPWAVTAAGWAVLVSVCATLYLRRERPVAVASGALVLTAVYYLTSAYDGPLMIAFVVALYSVAAGGRLWAAVTLAALSVIATAAGTLGGNEDVNTVALFMLTGWLVGIVALGQLRHSRIAYEREAERRAAGEERLRIARELHDVIGHHLSLINVQSTAALRRVRKDPLHSPEPALAAVKDTSREALRELRATLGVLRQADEAAPTGPAAGLDHLGGLVARTRATGPEVHVHRDGPGEPRLPTELDLAAYRVVQEALTNVTRHARATSVTVRIARTEGELTVEVTDNGRGPAPGTPRGSGISGMRERARALGGELTAGAAPGGGFTVRARLPLPNGVPSP